MGKKIGQGNPNGDIGIGKATVMGAAAAGSVGVIIKVIQAITRKS